MTSLDDKTKYLVVGTLYGICFVYSLILAPSIVDDYDDMNSLHESCLFRCKCDKLTSTRGANYYINSSTTTSDISDCLITFWSVSHMFLYSTIGFIAPDLFLPTFTIGALFEIFEYFYYDCADALDIVFNSVGFGIGYSINKMIFS